MPPRHATLLSNAAHASCCRRYAPPRVVAARVDVDGVDGAGLGHCHVQDLSKILHPVGRGRGGKTCRTARLAAPRTRFFVELMKRLVPYTPNSYLHYLVNQVARTRIRSFYTLRLRCLKGGGCDGRAVAVDETRVCFVFKT